MTDRELQPLLEKTVERVDIEESRFPGVEVVHGKVRDIFTVGDRMIITTTDRLSAFDVVLTTIPCKGEVLNRISLFWFDKTADIIDNHIIRQLSARSVLAHRYRPLPVEIVVRGYLTGSAWRDYSEGRGIPGIDLPGGMKFNQRFDTPILTPSTKAERGSHDEPISSSEVVERGLVDAKLWEKVQRKALDLFERGSSVVAEFGLILVDTKYEMGLDEEGELHLIDELHTPDSSRFWYADTYEELFAAGEKQRKLDKEYLRQWLMEERGYMGKGPVPDIPDEVRLEVARRYTTAFSLITGNDFSPEASDASTEATLVEETLREVGRGER